MPTETIAPAGAPLTLRERRQRRTRDELIDAVLAVVAAHGLPETTIDRIASASGVSRGTVYAYFPGGRDELLRAAYARIGRRLVDEARAAASEASDWRGRVVALARAMFELADDRRLGHFYNVSGPALITDAERGIGSGASRVMIRETLEAAQEAGEADPRFEADAIATLLVGAIREAAMSVSTGERDATGAYAAFARLVDGLEPR